MYKCEDGREWDIMCRRYTPGSRSRLARSRVANPCIKCTRESRGILPHRILIVNTHHVNNDATIRHRYRVAHVY